MVEVSISRARNELSCLLKRAARGERIVITRRGKAMAILVPPDLEPDERDVRQVVKEMREYRDRHGPTLGPGLTIRDLIEGGRR